MFGQKNMTCLMAESVEDLISLVNLDNF